MALTATWVTNSTFRFGNQRAAFMAAPAGLFYCRKIHQADSSFL
jgi:hypothetical protein